MTPALAFRGAAALTQSVRTHIGYLLGQAKELDRLGFDARALAIRDLVAIYQRLQPSLTLGEATSVLMAASLLVDPKIIAEADA